MKFLFFLLAWLLQMSWLPCFNLDDTGLVIHLRAGLPFLLREPRRAQNALRDRPPPYYSKFHQLKGDGSQFSWLTLVIGYRQPAEFPVLLSCAFLLKFFRHSSWKAECKTTCRTTSSLLLIWSFDFRFTGSMFWALRNGNSLTVELWLHFSRF
jgi:hypothetical protein